VKLRKFGTCSAMRNFRHFRQCNLGQILNKKNCKSSNFLTSKLFLNVCRLCVPKIMSLGRCFIKKCTSSKLARLLDTASKFVLFLVSGFERRKVDRKSKLTRKLKRANSILESFEYF